MIVRRHDRGRRTLFKTRIVSGRKRWRKEAARGGKISSHQKPSPSSGRHCAEVEVTPRRGKKKKRLPLEIESTFKGKEAWEIARSGETRRGRHPRPREPLLPKNPQPQLKERKVRPCHRKRPSPLGSTTFAPAGADLSSSETPKRKKNHRRGATESKRPPRAKKTRNGETPAAMRPPPLPVGGGGVGGRVTKSGPRVPIVFD